MTLSPRFLSMAVGSLALLVQAACGGAVVMDGGGGGAGGASGAGDPDTTISVGASPTTSVGASPTTSVGASPTTTGSAPPGPSAIVFGASTVTLRISSIALSCSDPEARPGHSRCSDWWDVVLRMPEWMLAVGELDTSNSQLELIGSSFRTDCSSTGAVTGGGAAAGFGRLTITAVDDDSVTFELSEVSSVFPGVDPNGRYVAARCSN
ncbi:hypothetical protein [Sorangium sp. So ce1024]|uniref:hypothetical protein n=1 Tax=unclassified Sorangium TaxID=2621164 RepID=UPI003F11394F